MREVAIAGMGLTKFGRYDGQKGRQFKEFYELGEEAIVKALRYAGMEWKDIQAAFSGSLYSGTASGHQCISRIGLTGIPIVNVENACSSSVSALRLAYQQVAYGLYDVALAFGFEKIPPGLLEARSFPVWQRMMGLHVMPAVYAFGVVRYMEDYGATAEDFARVAVMERKHATLNPNAMFYQAGEITVEEVLNSRMIASPITLLMACANADGASAAIVCSKDKLKSKEKAVTIAASVHKTGTYSSVKVDNPNCTQLAAQEAWEISGYGPEDFDVCQPYEAMAPSFLWDVEDLGICPPGEAPRLLREGYFEIGGKLSANTDGGLMGRGHPTGATGLAQIAEIFYQLREEAGPRQVPGAKIGFAHGAGAGPNAVVTVLKR